MPWIILFAILADDDGRLTVGGKVAEPQDIAPYLPGATPATVRTCLRSMRELGFLLEKRGGVLQLSDEMRCVGGKPSDSPDARRERVARHGARMRAQASVTPDVTGAGVTSRTRVEASSVTPDVTRGNALQGVTAFDVTPEKRRGDETRGDKTTPSASDAAAVSGDGQSHALIPVNEVRSADAFAERLAAVMREVETGTRTALTKREMRRLQAELVFAYWAARTGRERSLFDSAREQRLVKRLEENQGDVSELLYVVDGALKDAHLQGDNDRGRKYDGIPTIFRDRAQVERLAELCRGYRDGTRHPILAKYEAVVNTAEATETLTASRSPG